MHYGMVIDLKRCMGCQTCATACKMSNNLPQGVRWNIVSTEDAATIDCAVGTYPNALKLQHWPVACQHCQNAACESVCPTGATYKDPETGLILIKTEECIGCEACINACPYGVRVSLKSEPVWTVGFASGYQDGPVHKAGTVGKCTMCSNLVAKGEDPFCVQACIGKARFFGDLDDANSPASKLLASGREVVVLKPEAGTNPSVCYVR